MVSFFPLFPLFFLPLSLFVSLILSQCAVQDFSFKFTNSESPEQSIVPRIIFSTFGLGYECLDTCCSHFLTIIAGVDLHFRHESELPVCQTRGLNPVTVVQGEVANHYTNDYGCCIPHSTMFPLLVQLLKIYKMCICIYKMCKFVSYLV